MADYVTSEQVASFGHEFDALSNFDSVDLLVTSASRLFDNLCEVDENFFEVGDLVAPITYSDKTFVGDGTAYLKLPPYIELNPTDAVTVNEGTIDDEDFVIDSVPEYAEQNGMLVVLGKTGYLRSEAASYPHRFTGWPEGRQIEVSANWGWLATPADVQIACIHLAYHQWRTADPAFAVISNADNTVSLRTVPEIAQQIINKYREKYSRRALFG